MSTTWRSSTGEFCHAPAARLLPFTRNFLARAICLLLLSIAAVRGAEESPVVGARPSSANTLTYLDSSDPFYANQTFPKLTTPQWVGEPGVDAVVILAVDDMTDSGKYETFLRPILNRLKQ